MHSAMHLCLHKQLSKFRSKKLTCCVFHIMISTTIILFHIKIHNPKDHYSSSSNRSAIPFTQNLGILEYLESPSPLLASLYPIFGSVSGTPSNSPPLHQTTPRRSIREHVSQMSSALRTRGLGPSVPRAFQRHAIRCGSLPKGWPPATRVVFGCGGEEG